MLFIVVIAITVVTVNLMGNETKNPQSNPQSNSPNYEPEVQSDSVKAIIK